MQATRAWQAVVGWKYICMMCVRLVEADGGWESRNRSAPTKPLDDSEKMRSLSLHRVVHMWATDAPSSEHEDHAPHPNHWQIHTGHGTATQTTNKTIWLDPSKWLHH